MDLNHLFAEARAALEAGNLAHAEHCSRQLMQLLPGNGDILFLMGEVLEAKGLFEPAIDCFSRVQRQHSKDPGIHVRLGQCLVRAGRPDDAVKRFRQALKLKPAFIPALGNLGVLALEGKRFAEAQQYFERILKLAPDEVSTWLNLGNLHREAGDYAAARQCFQRVLELAPDFPGAYNNLGNVLTEQGLDREAASYYEQALKLSPHDVEVWINLGDCRRRLKNWDGTVEAYRRALSLRPDHVGACEQLGLTLLDMHRPADAVPCLRMVVRESPESAGAWVALGKAFLDLAFSGDDTGLLSLGLVPGERLEGLIHDLGFRVAMARESLSCSQHALELDPSEVAAMENTSLALIILGDFAAAERSSRELLARRPEFAGSHFSLAAILLTEGRYREGWQEYAWRMKISKDLDFLPQSSALPSPLDYMASSSIPDLSGKRVLVVRDQGIGDEMFFLRFLPALKARGAWVAYWPSPKIRSLLERAPAIAAIADDTTVPERIDVVTAVGDLPLLLGMGDGDAIPPPLPLVPRADRVQDVHKLLQAGGADAFMGITWRAGSAKRPGVRAGLNKNLPPEMLGRAVAGWHGEFVILQRGPEPGEVAAFEQAVGRAAIDLSWLNEDLEGMLALLSQLDDYVGVSNANMHLRASLGLPARVLVSQPAEWRWMADGGASPWFPAFSLYRESLRAGWADALAQIAKDLNKT